MKRAIAAAFAVLALAAAKAGATNFTVSNGNSSGAGSLLDAINQANAGGAGPHTISFSYSGLISPTSALPALTQPTTIQPPTIGAVTLNGESAGAGVDGLTLSANGCAVKSLYVTGFSGNGIVVASNNNTIGGSGGERNVISNNGGSGVLVTGSSNSIFGNRIGTNPAADADNGNAGNGITIQGGASNTVDSDILSGNDGAGVAITGSTATGNVVQNCFIGINGAATAMLPNSVNGVLVDGAGANTIGTGNVISGNGGRGVLINGGTGGTDVIGNTIGTNIAGTAAMANSSHGVDVDNSPNTDVGIDALLGTANLISGNGGNGVYVHGASAAGTRVLGNTIGTRQDGLAALPNALRGVAVFGTSDVVIGDPVTGKDNTISGNGQDGVYVFSSSNVRIFTNEIGNGGGNTAVPNNGSGVRLDGTTGALVDTSLIGGNTAHGIHVVGGSGVTIVGNIIGATLDGNSPLPNGINGISLENTSGNIIGQPGAGNGNIISGNGGAGIALTNASSNTIDAAVIGLNVAATAALPNASHGVFLQGTSNDNQIGVFGSEATYIATNAGSGNRIRGSRIYSNGGQAIDLDRDGVVPFDGVTYNDPGDVDTGANGLLNAPVLRTTTTTTVTGRLRGAPNTQHTIDLYTNPGGCDKVGFGEGQVFLTSTTLMTDGSGSATFALGPWAAVSGTSAYSATATDPAGNTSEHSQCAIAGRRPAETLSLYVPVPDTPFQPPPAALTGSLYGVFGDNLPAAAIWIFAPGLTLPSGQTGSLVMGDWNGDGIDTVGIYASGGAFFYTNDVGPTGNWLGVWFGFAGKPVVAGRLDGGVAHDCVGVVDNADNWQGSGDTAFAMYWTCDLTPNTNPPKTALWIGLPIPTSGFGNIGPHQFVVGDFTGSGVQTVAIRRGNYFVWSNLAQFFDHADGTAVCGDWDGDGISSFGTYLQTGQFFRINDLQWHSGAIIEQRMGQPLGSGETSFPYSWRPGGS